MMFISESFGKIIALFLGEDELYLRHSFDDDKNQFEEDPSICSRLKHLICSLNKADIVSKFCTQMLRISDLEKMQDFHSEEHFCKYLLLVVISLIWIPFHR